MIDWKERQRVARLALDLLKNYPEEITQKLHIEWSKRFTSRLGDATRMQGKYRLRFSVPLWERADLKTQNETVAHEAAHLVVMHRSFYRGRRYSDHGIEWKSVMREMGYNHPMTRHNVDNSGLRKNIKIQSHLQVRRERGLENHRKKDGQRDKIHLQKVSPKRRAESFGKAENTRRKLILRSDRTPLRWRGGFWRCQHQMEPAGIEPASARYPLETSPWTAGIDTHRTDPAIVTC